MLLRLTVHIYKTPEPISAIIRHASKSFYSFYKVFVCIIQIFEYFRDRLYFERIPALRHGTGDYFNSGRLALSSRRCARLRVESYWPARRRHKLAVPRCPRARDSAANFLRLQSLSSLRCRCRFSLSDCGLTSFGVLLAVYGSTFDVRQLSMDDIGASISE